MEFTYDAYRGLLASLRAKGYTFTDYFSWDKVVNPVILRHDIDFSLDAAVKLSELEAKAGISSTWFVLLKTDFYNVFTEGNRRKLNQIRANGGTLGLHFDESQYAEELQEILTRRGGGGVPRAVVLLCS